MTPPEALRDAIRARVVPERPDPDAASLARAVVEKGGKAVAGVLFFGSRKTQAGPDPWSAYDLFVVTRDYRGFYGALRAAGAVRRAPWVHAALNTFLPPNQISFTAPGADGTPRRGKCSIITERAFARETSARRRDHFCLGRLFQPTELLAAATEEDRRLLLDGLASAHALTWLWVRPWLPASFDAAEYARTALRVSLGREIRPEPSSRRADRLFEAQRAYHEEVYGALLGALAEAGELERRGAGTYALRRRPGLGERLRVEAYFRWSTVRATARWFKYMVTFEGWLDYIVRKAERHTGTEVVLTERERRLPLVFLWPRVLRYLRDKERPRPSDRRAG